MKKEIKDCELIALYNFLGKKWTIPLLHNIKTTPITFNELNRISKNMINPTLLSNRLKELIKFKIIKQAKVNNKVGYVLTKEGDKLIELLHKVKHWAIDCDYKVPEKCKQGKCVCDDVFSLFRKQW